MCCCVEFCCFIGIALFREKHASFVAVMYGVVQCRPRMICLFVLLVASSAYGAINGDWTMWGGDLQNSHFSNDVHITTFNVETLSPIWSFNTTGIILGIPTPHSGRLYFGDWDGNIYCLNADDGSVVWQLFLPTITGISTSFSRTTPAVSGSLIIMGDYASGNLFALDASSGSLVWKTLLDSHPAAVITQSATIFSSRVYVGVSSLEEPLAVTEENYVCCTFRGSFLSLDARSGSIIWQRYIVPDNLNQAGGYSGAAIWGSAPSIDLGRRAVYAASGNNYAIPASVAQCLAQNNDSYCSSPQNHAESIIAFDLETGSILWGTNFAGPTGIDVW